MFKPNLINFKFKIKNFNFFLNKVKKKLILYYINSYQFLIII